MGGSIRLPTPVGFENLGQRVGQSIIGKFSVSRMVIIIVTNRLTICEWLATSALRLLTVAVAVSSGLPAARAFAISAGVTAVLLHGSLTAGPSLLTLAVGFGSGGLLGLIESSPGVTRWSALLLIGVLEVGSSHGRHAVGGYRCWDLK